MTKRASPFDTHICRQLKIHVSDYENDLSVLKAVEEKTMKKLFNGSRNLNIPTTKTVENERGKSETHYRKPFMQKFVTNYFTVNGKMVHEKNCNIINPSEVIVRCFFCDSKTTSTYQCVHCSEFYCASCSFINYDSSEDNRICLSCS